MKKLKTPEWRHIANPKIELENWFKENDWTAWKFQQEAWDAFERGESGLIHVGTGSGKTYAAFLGPLARLMATPSLGLRIIYVTPLRALSRDIEKALKRPIDELKLGFSVESRTGDTSAATRARQRKLLPQILITTPESLALLLSQEDCEERLRNLESIIIDEWHELISSKRGSQLELCLSRIRSYRPVVQTWGLSATLGNIQEAAQALVGANRTAAVIRGSIRRPVKIESLLPKNIDSFPWAGHIGIGLIHDVLAKINIDQSTLIFTNTRRQAEKWFQAIILSKPEWESVTALHHGSLDREEREIIEEGIKSGRIRLVVCTSSLDLGVDFTPVEEVYQIGSPKAVSRIIQRAGRASHRPGSTCLIRFVPTHALELIEIAAVRSAIEDGDQEIRAPLKKPLDVLVQHMMTCAIGGGFNPDVLFDEVRNAYGFKTLTRDEFEWSLSLVVSGGTVLGAYPDFCRLTKDRELYRPANARITRIHRLNIGTITSDQTISVKYLGGKRLGSIEESYIAKLKRGDVFVFGGKILELIKFNESTAYVRPAKGRTHQTPTWQGGRLPISQSLSLWMRRILNDVANGFFTSKETQALKPLFNLQKNISFVPQIQEILIETLHSRDGSHLFVFPFEGRSIHEALAVVLALRMNRLKKATFTLSMNDYGIEFLSAGDFPFEEVFSSALFSSENLYNDILEGMNIAQLAKRQFRVIARVAGLTNQIYPGSRKSGHQVHASASLLYDVFERFDPDNLLVRQAKREVVEMAFEKDRLLETMERLNRSAIRLALPKRPSPLAFPLMVERVGARLSGESLAERVERMKRQWERNTKRSA